MTSETIKYYHGGPDGLKKGNFLLPPTITKRPSLSEYGAAGVHRRDRVYVATDINAAALYASCHKNGVIYECVPTGAIEEDPDCSQPGLSYQCERAKVLRVIKVPRDVMRATQARLFGGVITKG